MTPERLAEVAEREQRATNGPWLHEIDLRWSQQAITGKTIEREAWDVTYGHEQFFRGEDCYVLAMNISTEEDGAFIAHARTDIPDLLAYVRQLEADKARLEARNAELERRFQTMALDARRRD